MSFKHEEFWQPMDTLRDKHYLEELWNLIKPLGNYGVKEVLKFYKGKRVLLLVILVLKVHGLLYLLDSVGAKLLDIL